MGILKSKTSDQPPAGLVLPEAGRWQIDPAHSSVSFVARHLGLGKVRGRFDTFDGVITIGDDPASSTADVRIEAASITTGTAMRDDHLRSPDFFTVERFPHLIYRGEGIEQTGPNSFLLRGRLTIRDVTRAVDLQVTYEGVETNLEGRPRAAFSARGEINRHDFGLNWSPGVEVAGALIGKTVRIELDVTALPAAAEQAA